MAAHGHPKPQEPRAALLLCSPPSLPVQRYWQHETALGVYGYFKRSQQSHTFLVDLGQKLLVGAASSAVYCRTLFSMEIIGALRCWPKRN